MTVPANWFDELPDEMFVASPEDAAILAEVLPPEDLFKIFTAPIPPGEVLIIDVAAIRELPEYNFLKP